MLRALLVAATCFALRIHADLDSSHPMFSGSAHLRRDVVANWTGRDVFETFKAPPGQWANLTTHIDVQSLVFEGQGYEAHRSQVHVFTLYDPLRAMSGLFDFVD